MKQSNQDKERVITREWMAIFDFLRRNKWKGLPWTLHDDQWTRNEKEIRNAEIDRRLASKPKNVTYRR